MKIGYRKPNIKKSISARTFGQASRASRQFLPGYGQKGVGLVKDPKKAVYNSIYSKTSKSALSHTKSSRASRIRESSADLLGLYPYDKRMPLHLKIIVGAINAAKIFVVLFFVYSILWLIYMMFFSR